MEANTKNVRERLESILKHLKISQKEFSRMTGISENTISNAKKGKNIPVLDFFNSIYRAVPDLNPSWLYMGVGEMLNSSQEGAIGSVVQSISDFGEKVISRGKKWLGEKECNEELEKADREIEHLKVQLDDKKHIIKLLKHNNNNSEGNDKMSHYGNE